MSRILKRTLDLTVSILVLLLLSPILILVAVLIRLFLGAPVLFRQTRPGLNAIPFTLVKFRTMTDQRDPHGDLLPDHLRLTALGRFLRATSLDEFPQLLNVIRGDMSLVGPRPLLMQYLDRYTPDQARRHLVPPGVTGWAQINGRNTLTWEAKFAHDLWYVDNWTFLLDLRILALTAFKVLRRDGISNEASATMTEFMGSTGEPTHA